MTVQLTVAFFSLSSSNKWSTECLIQFRQPNILITQMSDTPFQNQKYSFIFTLFLPLFPPKFPNHRSLCVNFILYVICTLTLTLLPSSPATISTVTKPRWLSSVRTSVSRRGDPALRFGPLMEGTDSIPLEGLTNGIRGRTGFTCNQ